jgi:predicted lipoprotein with Yx(FWY)xxD motif
MKAALLACSILLTAAPFAASAQDAPAMAANGGLVAANGMTLYTFDKDPANAGKSACTGPCATYWPPYKASATDHATAPYSVVTRDDGDLQWAYKGKPLYFYSKDMAKGDRKGDGFKDVWHAAAP